MAPFKLFLIFSPLIVFVSTGYLQNKLIQFHRVGPCHGTNLPHQVFYQIGKCDTKSIFITNNTIIIKEDLMNTLKSTYTFTRCHSKENLDSCEEFKKLRNIDFCKSINPDVTVLGQKNFLAAPFVPKLKCPMKKGAYHAYNFTVDINRILFFSLDSWYWKIKNEVFSPEENNRLVSCTYGEMHTSISKSGN